MNPFSQIPGGIRYPQTSMGYSPFTPYPPYTPQLYAPHQNYSPIQQNIQSYYSYSPTMQPSLSKNNFCSFCGGCHHISFCPVKRAYDHSYWTTAYLIDYISREK
ncbi:unnamed protein product [Cuscuta europaea]|uniref:Uncharacterized protein n=1 Tax=Cuscuta europaea TaxID=41803 RepID=A0A9P0ZYG9_CUSEU|nr:unnamed protein product [Cuscuta europaea]